MKRQVVFIMVDTQAAELLTCYNQKATPTPNLDRIAEGGALFTNAYTASPVCGPARSAIFTGMYPSSNGIYGNGMCLGQDIKTAGQRLSEKGLLCGYIGKWHLDGGDYYGKGICPEGYDPRYWYDMRNYLDELPDDETREHSRKNMSAMVFGDVVEEDTYAYRCADRAIAFLREHKDEDFFLTVSFDEPHDPSQCPKKYAKALKQSGYRFTEKPNTNAPLENKPDIQTMWREQFNIPWPIMKMGFTNGYLACNTFVDAQIGRVLDAVEACCDNPLLIYTADHGDMMMAHGLMAKGAAMYNEITNVPLIIKGDVFQNRKITTPVSHVDLLPTIMEYFGYEKPRMLEGESLYHLSGDDERRDVFMEFFRYELELDGFLGCQPIRSIYDGRYKLNINLFSSDELYDLRNDPYELKNLIGDESMKETRNALHDRLLEHMNDTVDPFRGYPWAARPWRMDKLPSFHNDGYTRQRCEEGTTRYDYATGLPVTSELRKKGLK